MTLFLSLVSQTDSSQLFVPKTFPEPSSEFVFNTFTNFESYKILVKIS